MRSAISIITLAALAGTVAGCAVETSSSYPRYGYSQATYYPAGYYSYPTSYGYPSTYYSYPTSYGYRSSAYEYRHYNGIHPGPETYP
jgi:hypothetical protein